MAVLVAGLTTRSQANMSDKIFRSFADSKIEQFLVYAVLSSIVGHLAALLDGSLAVLLEEPDPPTVTVPLAANGKIRQRVPGPVRMMTG